MSGLRKGCIRLLAVFRSVQAQAIRFASFCCRQSQASVPAGSVEGSGNVLGFRVQGVIDLKRNHTLAHHLLGNSTHPFTLKNS